MFEPTFTTQHGVLFEEDALNILPSLQSGVMDCIFADPPFNLGKNYRNGFQANLDTSSYFTWCAEWLQEGARVLKPGGAFFVYATPELAIDEGLTRPYALSDGKTYAPIRYCPFCGRSLMRSSSEIIK